MTASSADTTIEKVMSAKSPTGTMGQKHLVSGKHVSMRLWKQLSAGDGDSLHRRDYETVGYVISGRAELYIGEQKLVLEPGDSWLVPRGAEHRYRVLEAFTAVEATAPPAAVHSRDEA